MTQIKIEVTGLKELISQLTDLGANAEEVVANVIEELAIETRNIAVAGVQGPPKTGRIYEKYKPRRTHQASAPGQYPAADTGSFGNSIKMEIGTMEARVGTGDDRGPWFEFGTSKMKARPWLQPSFEEAMIGVEKSLKAEIEALLK